MVFLALDMAAQLTALPTGDSAPTGATTLSTGRELPPLLDGISRSYRAVDGPQTVADLKQLMDFLHQASKNTSWDNAYIRELLWVDMREINRMVCPVISTPPAPPRYLHLLLLPPRVLPRWLLPLTQPPRTRSARCGI
jgi:hypothetical protein